MRHTLFAAVLALAAGTAAYAQDPAPKPDADAAHPPTNRMEDATPTMKAPAGEEHAPTNRVDEAVPPMKSTDAQSADTGTQAGTIAPEGQWIGRSVYSSDGKELGEVASLSTNNPTEFYVDIGGILGMGATRARILSEQVQEVKDDRIVLTLSEAEAKNLPAAEDETPPQQ